LTKRFRIPFISFVARRALVHAFLILLSFAAIAPLLIIWMTSLKTNTEVYVDPLALPRYWKFENFIDAWNQTHMGNYVLSSVKVSIPTIALVLVCASLAGYAFAKLRFRGSAIIFPLFLLGLMVPNISIAIPLYYTVVDIGLHDTHIGLILAEVSQALPLAIFLSRAAFLDLPGELRDAALIDGANEFDINTDRLQTMPLGLSYLHGRYQTNLVLLTAATTLISLPTILIYIVLQRQFIEGIVEGAIK
jgi:raffinose/stachyose/melibiose transport system permease protein